jgi:hypothetical protein
MTPGELLTNEEIRTLAGCNVRDAQARKLEELGVPYKRDGARMLVSRAHVRQWLLGQELRQSSGVNMGAIR